jgi:hypothetical protein
MPRHLRKVKYEQRFDDELKQIEPDFWRADECLQGAEWLLARDPERGYRANPSSNVWILPVVDVPGFRPVVIYYTFDDRYVYMLSIQLSSGGDGDS